MSNENTVSPSVSPAVEVVVTNENRASLERIRVVLRTMNVNNVTTYYLDVPYAWGVMMATAQRCAPIRSEFDGLRKFDPVHVDRYSDVANAMVCNQAMLTIAYKGKPDIAAMGVGLMKRRGMLFNVSDALADFGYFDGAMVKKMREGTGYGDLQQDVSAQLQLFDEKRDEIANKHPVPALFLKETDAELRAFTLALANKDRRDEELVALQEERILLAALAVESNRQLQRAAFFLELDKPGELFAPSVFEGGPGRSASPVTPPPPTPPVAPVKEPVKPARDPRDEPFDPK